jgi:hypothetical protein
MFDVAADLYRQGLQRGLAQHDVAAIFEVIDSLCAETDSRKAMQARRQNSPGSSELCASQAPIEP